MQRPEWYEKTAEEHGLICKEIKYWGWAKTSLNPDAAQYIKTIKVKKFEFFRKYIYQGGNLKRYNICPKCEKTVVFVSREQPVKCEKCNMRLVYRPSQKV